jgi:two-component system response regulator HydG
VDVKFLGIAVARAVQHSKLRAEVRRLKLVLGDSPRSERLVGDSPAMRRVNELIARVGASEASVLIQGETGTGKELVARAVHEASPRRDGPFVALNCAAVPPTLLESELFGHARGAFTDAKTARQGLFVEASGGTLFLDEIGEMPLEMQAKLLRALQERKVRPVGANTEISFDARIVTATHRDLEADVQKERFRQDLYYRINVVRIDVPALRERSSDVLKLAVHFLRTASERSAKGTLELSPQVADRLMAYDWPGNVRELENCIERAVALARFDHLTVEDLPEKIRAYRADRFVMAANEVDEILTIDEIERRYIIRVIKLLNGNKARAAQLLGLDRRTLYRKLERYETRMGRGQQESSATASREP